jgi:predicted ATPase
MMKRNGERYAEAEIARIRGVLALKEIEGGECSTAESQRAYVVAEDAFRQAQQIARQQGAKLYELRAATHLARLLNQLQSGEDARRLLTEVYDSFVEGFDAPDLRAARGILEGAS